MLILEPAIYGGGLVINDGMTATGYIHYALDKAKLYSWTMGEHLMEIH
jgi:hypothetical protein